MKAGRHTGRWLILSVFGAAASLPIAASGADAKVTINNTAFKPPMVTVGVGEKVVWTNQDDTEHTVTGDDFDSNPNCPGVVGVLRDCLTKGETFTHTFDQPGEFQYRCKLHPSMTGVVTVAAAEATTTTVATTATTQAPTTSSTAATTTTTRKLATSSTMASSTTTTTSTVPGASSTTLPPNEAPAFDPDAGGDGGTAAPKSSDGKGGGSGTVALIVAALLAVAGGGGVLLWRLRPRSGGAPPAG
jgi:plastocyanin